jgi:recombination protein RecT
MTKSITPYEEVKTNLAKMDDALRGTLPKSIESEKFRNTVMLAIKSKPDLLKANRNSLYVACMKAAADGLILDGREAALVKYGDIIQYQPMAEGIVKKILSTKKYKSVDSFVVYEKDEYDSYIDEHGPHFTFRKARGDRGKPILTVAFAISVEGGTTFEEMDEAQIEAVEAVSKQARKNKGPWKGAFRDEMRRKSALRRLAKRLLTSSDLANLFEHDNENYDLEPEPEEPKPSSGTTVAAQVIAEQVPEVEPPVEDDDVALF